jgi:hypothetical protein
MPEVRRGIGHHRAGVGADEVVLLSVTMQQRRPRLRAAHRRQPMHHALDATGEALG